MLQTTVIVSGGLKTENIMNFKCIFIKPDLSTEERIGDSPYLFPEFSEGEPFKEYARIDTELPCGAYLHTSNRPEGTYILITKQM